MKESYIAGVIGFALLLLGPAAGLFMNTPRLMIFGGASGLTILLWVGAFILAERYSRPEDSGAASTAEPAGNETVNIGTLHGSVINQVGTVGESKGQPDLSRAQRTADAAIRQHEFQALSPTLERTLRRRLEQFKMLHAASVLTVFVDVESGSVARDRVAQELGGVLSELQLGQHRRGTYGGVYPENAVTLVHGKGGEAIAADFRESIAVFLTADMTVTELSAWKPGILRLYIYGTPLFEESGAVRIE